MCQKKFPHFALYVISQFEFPQKLNSKQLRISEIRSVYQAMQNMSGNGWHSIMVSSNPLLTWARRHCSRNPSPLSGLLVAPPPPSFGKPGPAGGQILTPALDTVKPQENMERALHSALRQSICIWIKLLYNATEPYITRQENYPY